MEIPTGFAICFWVDSGSNIFISIILTFYFDNIIVVLSLSPSFVIWKPNQKKVEDLFYK